MNDRDRIFAELETLRESERRLRLEVEELRGTVREQWDRLAELERTRDEIQRDANRALEERRRRDDVTMDDDIPPATTSSPAIAGYMHRTGPWHTPRPVAANEVLPPERRASWARGKTEHDR